MAITGTFKTYTQLKDDAESLGGVLDDKFDSMLQAVGGRTVPLTEFNPADQTFRLSDNTYNIYNITFGVGSLVDGSVDFGGITYLYADCGFIADQDALYPYAATYTWGEVYAGNVAETPNAALISSAALTPTGFYKDGKILCPKCKTLHTFKLLSNLVINY